ncbi:SRPBCC family protein [Kitasatospora sp. NBC_01300]|uniref:SRPBCC family protein n=1 Tax=Kitasatospora sp. NBC_01300 TaxID=2903574 RepID=UPI002F90E8F6|nr:SRPBCC family protein [Kitasatospora sp. NBC_01300]
MHVITVTRHAEAAPETIWGLFADVPARTRWDDSLERADIRGPFRLGASGTVKLKGQPERRFEILECEPPTRYTDRYFLPMGGRMDWIHAVSETATGCDVTFDIHVNGPTSFILRPVMKRILGRALPPTVDKLVAVAEATTS